MAEELEPLWLAALLLRVPEVFESRTLSKNICEGAFAHGNESFYTLQ